MIGLAPPLAESDTRPGRHHPPRAGLLVSGHNVLDRRTVTIIWYAAIEQERTWILWVAGIITGVAIIALFGLFEKRRDDVLRLVEKLKEWEA